jgi:hypothetical protein
MQCQSLVSASVMRFRRFLASGVSFFFTNYIPFLPSPYGKLERKGHRCYEPPPSTLFQSVTLTTRGGRIRRFYFSSPHQRGKLVNQHLSSCLQNAVPPMPPPATSTPPCVGGQVGGKCYRSPFLCPSHQGREDWWVTAHFLSLIPLPLGGGGWVGGFARPASAWPGR